MITKLKEYKGVTYKNNMWHLRDITHRNLAELITFSGNNTKYEVRLTDDDFIPLMELKNAPYEDVEYKDILQNVTDEELNAEYFRRFRDYGFNTNLI